MFLQLSVSHSVHRVGVCLSACWDTHQPPPPPPVPGRHSSWADIPWADIPPEQTPTPLDRYPPPGQTPPSWADTPLADGTYPTGLVSCLKIFWWTHVLLLGHQYPCFGLLVTPLLGFKTRAGSLTCTWQRHMWCMFPDIHLWCDTFQPLDSQHGGHLLSPHACFSRDRIRDSNRSNSILSTWSMKKLSMWLSESSLGVWMWIFQRAIVNRI